jgi:hypothetical protein
VHTSPLNPTAKPAVASSMVLSAPDYPVFNFVTI